MKERHIDKLPSVHEVAQRQNLPPEVALSEENKRIAEYESYKVVTDRALTEAVHSFCYELGLDPGSDGLSGTGLRIARAWREMCSGYTVNPADVLGTAFECSDYNEMILVKGIRFTSVCEHHFLPFSGTAALAYIPGPAGKVVGLSKLPRLVECYARRLQLQERLTVQLTQALWEHLRPLGCAAFVRATHSCMSCRGVRKPDAEMITSSLRGVMLDEPETRAEVVALAN